MASKVFFRINNPTFPFHSTLQLNTTLLHSRYKKTHTFLFKNHTSVKPPIMPTPLVGSAYKTLSDWKTPLFFRYFFNGLGYKIFVKNNQLLIWIGLTHYTILDIPPSIHIFSKKRRFFILGWDRRVFNEFITKLRRIRRIDLYKAKGLSEVRTYKGFIKMKSGKKKQY